MMLSTPEKLRKGDELRVIAPARSLSLITPETKAIALERLHHLGFRVTFGKHVEEKDEGWSSSVASRVEDIHDAFADPTVKGILTVIGGWNSNQLLDQLDWDLIRQHPKVFCGYSDITALGTAIAVQAGFVTYSGPHFSSFGQKLYGEYAEQAFLRCVAEPASFSVTPSASWSDDAWYLNQDDRHLFPQEGYWVLQNGQASGTVWGGNLGTLQLLQGTRYFPKLENAVLFLEDTAEVKPHHFDRMLQSLIQVEGFSGVRGLVIGRFQPGSGITKETLSKIIQQKPELRGLPILANADFGHTDPRITFPLGGAGELFCANDSFSLQVTTH